MASASRALLPSRLSLLPAAASRSLRPLAAAGSLLPAPLVPSPAATARRFATQPAQSSLRDSSPNWSNRPPKEAILLDGCDFEHWLVVMEPPPGDGANPDIPRDEIIDSYIKTLAQVIGSEEEARMKIYSVSTRHYFAFGALVCEELSYKLKELPKVRWVLPDSYLNVKNKDYGGEPFIDGQAVPYDPKYHEEWVINNRRANEPRNKRGDRPRNFDKRRENTQAYQSRPAPPSYQSPRPPSPEQNQMPPHDASPMRPAQGPPNPQSGYVRVSGPNYQNAPPRGYQGAQLPATKLITKVTMVATCTVVQALPIRATTQDTRVEGQVAIRRPLPQVPTILPTKVLVLAMVVVVHKDTKTEATRRAATTTIMRHHRPMRPGMGQGGITDREHY